MYDGKSQENTEHNFLNGMPDTEMVSKGVATISGAIKTLPSTKGIVFLTKAHQV